MIAEMTKQGKHYDYQGEKALLQADKFFEKAYQCNEHSSLATFGQGQYRHEAIKKGQVSDKQQEIRITKLIYEGANAYWHPKARNALGELHYNETKDYQQAAEWFQHAVSIGDSDAFINLGICYEKGHGVEKNTEEALSLYKKSFEKGNLKALFLIGYLYL